MNTTFELNRRQLFHGAGAGIVGVAASSTLGNLAYAATQSRFPGDPGVGKVLYGACLPATTPVKDFEAAMGRNLGARRNFHSATQVAGLIARARDDVAAKRFSILSTKPPASWRDVALGKHDAWMDQILTGLAAINAPMCLTIHHEPEENVDGLNNTPAWHVAMTERLFARAAATAPKVNIIQIFMQWTFDPKSGRNPAEWLAPSPRLFGMDCYNVWSPTGTAKWVGFDVMVQRAQTWAGGRPVVIGEHGVREDPLLPARSAAWIKDAFTWGSTHNVVSMCYFNVDNGDLFNLDGARLEAFRKNLLSKTSVPLPLS